MENSEVTLLPIRDDLKSIYYSLLRHSPLTFGELLFLTGTEEEALRDVLGTLENQGIVQVINGDIPLYLAIPPSLLVHSNVQKYLDQFKTLAGDVIHSSEEERKVLDEKLETSSTSLQTDVDQLVEDVRAYQKRMLVEFNNRLEELVQKTLTAQKDTIQEIQSAQESSQVVMEERIDTQVESVQHASSGLLTEVEDLKERLHDSVTSNKKQLRKLLQETTKQLEEGANFLGKTIQEKIQDFEEELVGSLRDSISSSVTLSQSLRDELSQLANSMRKTTAENSDMIGQQHLDLLGENLRSIHETFDGTVGQLTDRVEVTRSNFETQLEGLSQKSQAQLDAKHEAFAQNLKTRTDLFLSSFEETRDTLDSFFSESPAKLTEFTDATQTQLDAFLEEAIAHFERNLQNLDLLVGDFQSKLSAQIQKEFQSFMGENHDILDRLGDFAQNLNKNFMKEVRSWERTVELLNKSLTDLSHTLKRRIEKFSSDSNSLLQTTGAEITEEIARLEESYTKISKQLDLTKKELAELFADAQASKGTIFNQQQEWIQTTKELVATMAADELGKVKAELSSYHETVETRQGAIKKAIQDQMKGFLASLQTDIRTATEKAEQAMRQEHEEFVSSLDEVRVGAEEANAKHQTRLLGSLERVNETISRNLDDALAAITNAFTKIKEELSTDLVEQEKVFRQSFQDMNNTVLELTQSYVNRSERLIHSTTGSFRDTGTIYWSKFADGYESSIQKITDVHNNNSEAQKLAESRLLTDVEVFTTSVRTKVTQLMENLGKDLLNLSQNLTTTLESAQSRAEGGLQTFDTVTQGISQAAAKGRQGVEGGMKEIQAELGEVVVGSAQDLDQQIKDVSGSVQTLVDGLVESTQESLASLDQEAISGLADLRVLAEEKLTAELDKFSNIIDVLVSEQKGQSQLLLEDLQARRGDLEGSSTKITTNLVDGLVGNLQSIQMLFTTLFNRFTLEIPSTIESFQKETREVVQTLEQTFSQEFVGQLSASSEELNASIIKVLQDNKKTLQVRLDEISGEFESALAATQSQVREQGKVRVQEVGDQLSKTTENYQSKLVKKEATDVKKLREVMQSGNLDILGQIVDEHIIGGINPFRESVDNELDTYRETIRTFLNDYAQELKQFVQSLNEGLSQVKEALSDNNKTSTELLGGSHLTMTDHTSQLRTGAVELVESSLEENYVKQKEILNRSKEQLGQNQQRLRDDLTSFIQKVIHNLTNARTQFTNLSTDYQAFFENMRELIEVETTHEGLVYQARPLASPIDVKHFLTSMITHTEKKLSLIAPDISQVPVDKLLELPSKARVKLVTAFDEEDNTWLATIYKAKGNVQVYNYAKEKNPHLLLCISDDAEALIVSTKPKEGSTPGFIITSSHFVEFFDRAIISRILSDSTFVRRAGMV